MEESDSSFDEITDPTRCISALNMTKQSNRICIFSVGEVPKIVGFFVPQNNLPQQIAGPSKAKKEISELQLKLSQFGNLFQKCVVFII